jgi:transcriptional regulator with XRE-family HTH domain
MNGPRLRTLRRAAGIKTGLFASRVGISRRHLVNIEGSGSVCSIEVANLMANELGVETDELLAEDAGTGPRPTHPKKRTDDGTPPPPPPPPAESLGGAA